MVFPISSYSGSILKICLSLILLRVETIAASPERKGRIFHPPSISGGGEVIENLSPQPNNMGAHPVIRVVFSDVDGTLVHYPTSPSSELDKETSERTLLQLPPSSTGMRGVISLKTLQLCQRLRQMQVPSCASQGDELSKTQRVQLVLVSGMRTTTLFQRLPYLPFADAYCCENGGRIFYPEPLSAEEDAVSGSYDKNGCYIFSPRHSEAQRYRLVEDMTWRQRMSQPDYAGPDAFPTSNTADPQTAIPVEQRQGKLWEFASQLKRRGWILDDRGYATCFRVHQKTQIVPNLDIDKDLKLVVPLGLVVTENLGCVDVYPHTSGKKNA